MCASISIRKSIIIIIHNWDNTGIIQHPFMVKVAHIIQIYPVGVIKIKIMIREKKREPYPAVDVISCEQHLCIQGMRHNLKFGRKDFNNQYFS